MSGELTLEGGLEWKRVLPAVLLAVLGTLLVAVALLRFLPLEEGLVRAAVSAILAYVVFRLLYPACLQLTGWKAAAETLVWTLDAGTLTLGQQQIPLSSIRQVHCWPNRDALGHAQGGWTVNIETSGRNQVLRSLREGAAAEQSVRQLQTLVEALGYGNRWPRDSDAGAGAGAT